MFEGAGEREKGMGKGFIQPSLLIARNLGYMYQECTTFLVHISKISGHKYTFQETMDTLTRHNNNKTAPACTCPCSQLVSGLVTNKTKGSRLDGDLALLPLCLSCRSLNL